MKYRFTTFSFGCRVNQAEIAEIDRKMIEAGYIKNENRPDIFIINSCAVTNKAEREIRQYIYRLRKKSKKMLIVLTGCSATYWQQNNLFKSLPVDVLVDNANKKNVVNIINNLISHLTRNNEIIDNINKYSQSARMLIKIQDGCHRFCRYCIVPYLRGQPKSEKIDSILEIISGYKKIKEVILTAVNTEDYGKDTGENLIDLLKKVIAKTSISRISLGSINPWSITKEFLIFYRNYFSKNRLVNFFHIPLQSGSDKILNLMKRDYTTKEYLEKIRQLKNINAFCFIATDIIVGFLEESEYDFQQTYELLDKSPISKFHIFRFSQRPGTAAFYMAKKHKEPDFQIKYKRAKILAILSIKKYWQFLMKHLNYKSSALFLTTRKEDCQLALLDNQLPGWIKTNKNLSGEIKNVKIESLRKSNLFGKLI